MAAPWFINILLAVTFATVVSAWYTCGSLEMIKEVTTSDKFEQTLRKTYKNVTSKLDCARLCYEDVRCNGILVCPDVCYLFGVFNAAMSHGPATAQSSASELDYRTCEIFTINRCENNGFPDGNGYCSCVHGFGGPLCDVIVHESCYNKWFLYYDTVEKRLHSNVTITESNYCGIRTKALVDEARVQKMDELGYSSGISIWTQSVYELEKESWDRFESIPKRIFKVYVGGKFKTAASVDVEGLTIPKYSNDENIKWYVKNVTDGGPLYRNDETGSVQADAFRVLLSNIKNGSAVPSLHALFLAPNEIAAESLTTLNLSVQSNLYALLSSPPTWSLHRFISSGYINAVPWRVAQGSTGQTVNDTASHTWCTDDCWIKVLTTDQFGKGAYGSTTHLAGALLGGHQLRVHTGSVAAYTRAVYIHDQTVSAVLEDMMDPLDATQLDSTGTAQRKMVSSNGRVQTRRYTLETDIVINDLEERTTIDWFMDLREWIQIISVNGNGQVLSGLVTDLREKVLNGASVRIVVEFTSGVYQILDVDHLELFGDHAAAEIIYHANIQLGDNYNITFTPASTHHLWSAIITTEGVFRKYYYTYKRNEAQHETVPQVVRYTWFIQM